MFVFLADVLPVSRAPSYFPFLIGQELIGIKPHPPKIDYSRGCCLCHRSGLEEPEGDCESWSVATVMIGVDGLELVKLLTWKTQSIINRTSWTASTCLQKSIDAGCLDQFQVYARKTLKKVPPTAAETLLATSGQDQLFIPKASVQIPKRPITLQAEASRLLGASLATDQAI